MSRTIQVNIPIGRKAEVMNLPTPPSHTQNLKLQALCEDQLRLIQTQKEILEVYEAELDRQSLRLSKCLWAIAGLSLALILAVVAR